MRALAALVTEVVLLAPLVAFAEEDVTPPVLTEITVVPSVFDAGIAEITLTAAT